MASAMQLNRSCSTAIRYDVQSTTVRSSIRGVGWLRQQQEHPRHVATSAAPYGGPEMGRAAPPPPPPPPPPFQPQSDNRRNVLLLLGGVGAMVGAAAVGLNLQSSSAQPGSFSAEERREIDRVRAESGFRREYDGHVWLQAGDGSWVEVRTDARMPGTVLLRDKEGFVYFITYPGAQQIDLTDDQVVIAVFGDRAWEQQCQRVTAKDDSDKLVDVQLDQDSFREIISLLD